MSYKHLAEILPDPFLLQSRIVCVKISALKQKILLKAMNYPFCAASGNDNICLCCSESGKFRKGKFPDKTGSQSFLKSCRRSVFINKNRARPFVWRTVLREIGKNKYSELIRLILGSNQCQRVRLCLFRHWVMRHFPTAPAVFNNMKLFNLTTSRALESLLRGCKNCLFDSNKNINFNIDSLYKTGH